MTKFISFDGDEYPAFQAEGNAAQFVMPFAEQLLKGKGYDVGCGKKEWALPWAIPIDPNIDPSQDGMNLPLEPQVDFIFSSHCLEHLPNYVAALEHWSNVIKLDGKMLLYLPDYSQKYWRPWNNKKHIHVLSPQVIIDCLSHCGWTKVLYGGVDLNNSFTIFATR